MARRTALFFPYKYHASRNSRTLFASSSPHPNPVSPPPQVHFHPPLFFSDNLTNSPPSHHPPTMSSSASFFVNVDETAHNYPFKGTPAQDRLLDTIARTDPAKLDLLFDSLADLPDSIQLMHLTALSVVAKDHLHLWPLAAQVTFLNVLSSALNRQANPPSGPSVEGIRHIADFALTVLGVTGDRAMPKVGFISNTTVDLLVHAVVLSPADDELQETVCLFFKSLEKSAPGTDCQAILARFLGTLLAHRTTPNHVSEACIGRLVSMLQDKKRARGDAPVHAAALEGLARGAGRCRAKILLRIAGQAAHGVWRREGSSDADVRLATLRFVAAVCAAARNEGDGINGETGRPGTDAEENVLLKLLKGVCQRVGKIAHRRMWVWRWKERRDEDGFEADIAFVNEFVEQVRELSSCLERKGEDGWFSKALSSCRMARHGTVRHAGFHAARRMEWNWTDDRKSEER